MTYASAPAPGGPADQKKSNGLSVGALICGIIAFIVAWIPCINLLAWPLLLVAIGLGIAGAVTASKDPNQKPTLAYIGIGLGVLAIPAFFISYMVFAAGMERVGGGLGQWGITTAANTQADAYAEQARQRGVDEQIITDARAELDAVIDAVPEDVEGLEQAQQDIETAMEQYRQTLQNAPGDTTTDAPAELGVEEEPATDTP